MRRTDCAVPTLAWVKFQFHAQTAEVVVFEGAAKQRRLIYMTVLAHDQRRGGAWGWD